MTHYEELALMSYAQSCALERKPVGPHMYLTGHHIIPDHCFYICKGGRSAQGVQSMQILGTASYRTSDAPVIMLTSDSTGGKVFNHGDVHAIFDPVEKTRAGKGTWTYEEVRELAIESIVGVFENCDGAKVAAALDSYFIERIGLTPSAILRCGEHSSLAGSALAMERRKSNRANRRNSPY